MPTVIEVLDPNNNYYEVARATSDGSGFYRCTFEPPVPGEYAIIASFKGSEAYYGSYAETAIVWKKHSSLRLNQHRRLPQLPTYTSCPCPLA